jgi:hypothetical protein
LRLCFGGTEGSQMALLVPFDPSWESTVRPIRNFQTVSLCTPVKKGTKSGLDLAGELLGFGEGG